MRLRKLLAPLFGALLCLPWIGFADTLRSDHPERYVVQRGDTLWDISERFLNTPWLWPEIWLLNQEIENPHLIYPGDVISLVFVDGQPRLTITREGRAGPTVYLSPRVREEALTDAIHTIPLEGIRPFLTETEVLSDEQLNGLPYILAGEDDRVMGSRLDRVYARGLENGNGAIQSYAVVRRGDAFVDPDTGDHLGYAAIHVGDAVLERDGDPATFSIIDSNREILTGDRLLAVDEERCDRRFRPRAPTVEVDGRIMSVLDGVTQIGQYSVVAINRGTEHGLETGDVLAIYQQGRTVRDPHSGRWRDTVQLPDEHAGELIVFRTFDRLSFGLVMRATRAMHTHDLVRNP